MIQLVQSSIHLTCTGLCACRLDASVRRHHHHRPHGTGPYTRADNNSGNQVGNSATKHGTHLSVGASTTLHDSGRNALVNTAEGRLPAGRWGVAQHHHQPLEGSPDVEQPESCINASLNDQQLGLSASADASLSREARSGADTAVVADRQSQPQTDVGCPADLAKTNKRSAACLSPTSCEQSDGKRVAKGSCGPDADTAPCGGVEGSLLPGDACLPQAHGQSDKRVTAPQEPHASIPSAKTASDETNLDSLRLAELAHGSQGFDQPSSGVVLTIKPLLTGAQEESTDTAQPGPVVSSAYQQHHSQPSLQANHPQQRRPVQVLYSQQQQQHAPSAVRPCVPVPSSRAPLLATDMAPTSHTLLDTQQLFSSQQKQQQHVSSVLSQWAGQLPRGELNSAGNLPLIPYSKLPPPGPGAAVPPPSHATRAAAFVAQLGHQPSHPRTRDADLHGMGLAETSAAMAASGVAASAFYNSGMAPPLHSSRAAGRTDVHMQRADIRAGLPARLGSLPLDPLTAMSAFLQQLSHEHMLALTQVGVGVGGLQPVKWGGTYGNARVMEWFEHAGIIRQCPFVHNQTGASHLLSVGIV